MYIFSWNSW